MASAARIRGRIDGELASARDRGASFIELMVAIVLLGMCVLATLVALRTTTSATITDREHAEALAWLQSAADEVYNTSYVVCPTADHFETVVGAATRPDGWVDAVIDIPSIEFLTRSSGVYSWATTCDASFTAQKITIRVRTPEGMVRTLDVVKSLS